MEVDRKLQKLVELLGDPRIKSKQSAFDLCYQEIEDARSFYSWSVLVEFIEKQTGVHINPITASTMFRRSKQKKINLGKTISPITTDANVNGSDNENAYPVTFGDTERPKTTLVEKEVEAGGLIGKDFFDEINDSFDPNKFLKKY